MVFLFRDKSIANIFFLLLLSLAVHLHFFIVPPPVVANVNDGAISMLIANYATSLPQSALFVVYVLVVVLQAIRLNMVLGEMRMFQNNSYTTAMAYVLLSGILPQWCSISSALVANFLLIWIFIKLSRLYNHPSPKTLLFNTGLIVGFSVICYHPTAILIGVVLFALMVVRPFRLAEWVILLMGVLLPYYFLFAFLYLGDRIAEFKSFLPYLQLHLPLTQWSIALIVQVSLLFVMMVAGLVYWQLTHKRMVIQIRKNWGVMMVMLFILLPIPFLFQQAGIESAFMCAVPLAAFSSNAFSVPRRLVLPNILFWLAVAVLAYNNWTMVMQPG
ncbi:DUF6427 family protein [Sediminibacterium soli]|uniref:DUF6427 family protein n=1 Tax=Sediminibacterium soli TaxID=2698829 RepID=UPI001379A68B|nr:DUF6427 family protein [Sediminibacterium soli]NCI47294.1 hypothetical protein [Sediminibacterium soli]